MSAMAPDSSWSAALADRKAADQDVADEVGDYLERIHAHSRRRGFRRMRRAARHGWNSAAPRRTRRGCASYGWENTIGPSLRICAMPPAGCAPESGLYGNQRAHAGTGHRGEHGRSSA